MTTGGPESTPDTTRDRLQQALASQYLIHRELGGGGMSRVFVAEDVTLGRKVVVKVLLPSLASELSTERFAREIRLSARLQHPGIVPVLSAGVADGLPYYTMPWVAGESLRHRLNSVAPGERLPISQSTAILRDIARALAFAHSQGVIHRDIKPENVLLSADAAMVADFGVAKALDAARSDHGHHTMETLTRAGTSLGTPAYMSPEQAAGDPEAGVRSDLYALGVLAWEMLAGAHPFAHRQSVQAMTTAHLVETPRPLREVAPEISAALHDVVMQCLSKNQEERPDSATALVDALADTRPQGTRHARRSPPERKPLRQSMRNVSIVLSTITIVAAIAGVVNALLNASDGPGGESVSSTHLDSPGYDSYALGKVKVARENRADNEAAIGLLRRAVNEDPNLAPAWAALSRAYSIRAFYFAPDSEKRVLADEAQIAADRAMALEPDLADGYFAKGLLLWTPARRFPHDQAIVAYKRAIALDPRNHEAHHQLALVLLHVGLLDEAWQHVDSALSIEPTNALARFRYGVISSYRGDYARAEEYFRTTSATLNPSLWVFQQGAALFRLGFPDSAKALITNFLATDSLDEGGVNHSVLAMIAASKGQRAAADSAIRKAIDRGRTFGHFHHTAFQLAVAETLLGRKTEAIRWLEMAAEDGFPCYPLFAGDSILAALVTEPRFKALLERTRNDMDRYRGKLR